MEAPLRRLITHYFDEGSDDDCDNENNHKNKVEYIQQ